MRVGQVGNLSGTTQDSRANHTSLSQLLALAHASGFDRAAAGGFFAWAAVLESVLPAGYDEWTPDQLLRPAA